MSRGVLQIGRFGFKCNNDLRRSILKTVFVDKNYVYGESFSMRAPEKKMRKVLKEVAHGLDSLFRFYGTQITAHASYLVASVFAFAVFFYRLLERLFLSQVVYSSWYDVILGGILLGFVLLFFYLLQRSLYYNELINIVQTFMGLSQIHTTPPTIPPPIGQLPNLTKFTDLIEKRLLRNFGLAETMTDTLYCRVRWCFFGEVEKGSSFFYEDFEEVCKIYPISKVRSWRIILVNLISPRYRATLGKIIN